MDQMSAPPPLPAPSIQSAAFPAFPPPVPCVAPWPVATPTVSDSCLCRRRNEPAGQRLLAIAGKDRRGSFAVPADEYALGVAGCQERSYDILWSEDSLDATGRVC